MNIKKINSKFLILLSTIIFYSNQQASKRPFKNATYANESIQNYTKEIYKSMMKTCITNPYFPVQSQKISNFPKVIQNVKMSYFCGGFITKENGICLPEKNLDVNSMKPTTKSKLYHEASHYTLGHTNLFSTKSSCDTKQQEFEANGLAICQLFKDAEIKSIRALIATTPFTGIDLKGYSLGLVNGLAILKEKYPNNPIIKALINNFNSDLFINLSILSLGTTTICRSIKPILKRQFNLKTTCLKTLKTNTFIISFLWYFMRFRPTKFVKNFKPTVSYEEANKRRKKYNKSWI